MVTFDSLVLQTVIAIPLKYDSEKMHVDLDVAIYGLASANFLPVEIKAHAFNIVSILHHWVGQISFRENFSAKLLTSY